MAKARYDLDISILKVLWPLKVNIFFFQSCSINNFLDIFCGTASDCLVDVVASSNPEFRYLALQGRIFFTSFDGDLWSLPNVGEYCTLLFLLSLLYYCDYVTLSNYVG